MMKPSGKQLSCSRLLRGFLNTDSSGPAASNLLPLYLCPAAARACATLSPARTGRATSTEVPRQRFLSLYQTRKVHTESPHLKDDLSTELLPIRKLPIQCHGCGALSQTAVPNEPGYYNLDRKPVKVYLGIFKEETRHRPQDDIIQASLGRLGEDELGKIGIDSTFLRPEISEGEKSEDTTSPETPLCDRCHNLVHHHTGRPIFHPTIDAIRDTIEESPYKYNHVYHVLDAADFPMSLLPKIHQLLDLMPLRTKNRRSTAGKFHKGKMTEMSFIITRSDLLAPKKEQVDKMLPYLTETLRQALPRDSRDVRLGNVRCVSAKRNWWTKELKEDIWKRGGAGWMVGKANVGKSQLFQTVFPKGRMDTGKPKHDISVMVHPQDQISPLGGEVEPESMLSEFDGLEEDSLLPPPQVETNYPQMPVVSSLPGTTASPIRVPFGGGKGELIDLPGLSRGELDEFVQDEHRESLLMKARITPEQNVMKPGQSILIGGFIRITPRTPDLIFLSYAFTPIKPHLTSTEKAIAIQSQTGGVNVENISIPGTGEKIKHAGSFALKYDVTKKRTGPITRRDAVAMKVDRLPYRVLSLDIIIEGCGWVEITAQVRTRDLFKPPPPPPPPTNPVTTYIDVGGEQILQDLDLSPEQDQKERHQDTTEDELCWPVVDVFSPEGRFIGSRPPMNAWLYNKILKTPETSKKRPRRSMTGVKKKMKAIKRATM